MELENSALSVLRQHFEAPRVVTQEAVDYFYETYDSDSVFLAMFFAGVAWTMLGGMIIIIALANWWGLILWIAGILGMPAIAFWLTGLFQREDLRQKISDCQIVAAEIVSFDSTNTGAIVTVKCRLAYNFNNVDIIQKCILRVRRSDFGLWKNGARMVALYDPTEKKISLIIGRPGLDPALPLTLPNVTAALLAVKPKAEMPIMKIESGEETLNTQTCTQEEKERAMDALKDAYANDKIDARLLSERIEVILKAKTSQEIARALEVHISRL